MTPVATGDTYTWTGADAATTWNWSDPGNWTCSGSGCTSSSTPISDSPSDVVFPASLSAANAYEPVIDQSVEVNSLTMDSNQYFIGGSGSLTVDGTTTLDGRIFTLPGADTTQTYDGPVVVAGSGVTDALAASGVITFNSTVDGAVAGGADLYLPTDAVFNAPVGSSVPLGELTNQSGASITINASSVDVTTYLSLGGPVTLEQDTTITAPESSTFNAVDGGHSLTVRGNPTFVGDVGGITPLSQLTVTGGAGFERNVTTTGSQTYESWLAVGTTPSPSTITMRGSLVIVEGAAHTNGQVTVDAPLTLSDGGDGFTDLDVNGSLSLTGGTLEMTGDLDVGGILDGSGGTLKLDGGSTQRIQGSGITLGALDVSSGSTLDLQGNPVTAGTLTGAGNLTNSGSAASLTLSPTGADTYTGAISGALSLTMSGAGSLTLSGENTYSGATDIENGTLQLPGSLAGALVVASGASASILGTVDGPVTVDGGSLSCDDGTLNGGPVTNHGGTLQGAPAPATDVSATGGKEQATVTFTPGQANCDPASSYTVTAVPGGESATGTGSPITVPGLRDKTTYTFTVTQSNPIGTTTSPESAPVMTESGAPKASISRPTTNGRYDFMQKVPTTFSCAEGTGGPGISSCRDSNGASGGAGELNTSRVGEHAYRVTAVSKDGQRTSATITYTVLPPNRFTIEPNRPQPTSCGVTRLRLNVPWAGKVDVVELGEADSTFAQATAKVSHPGEHAFRLRPGRRVKRGLNHLQRQLTLRLRISFTPAGGEQRTQTIRGLHLSGICRPSH